MEIKHIIRFFFSVPTSGTGNSCKIQCINHARNPCRGKDAMVWIGLHPVDGNWAWTNSDPLSGYVLLTDFVTLSHVFSM